MRNLRIAVCDDDMTDLDSEKQLIEKALLKLGCKYKIDKFSSSEELLGSDKTYNIIFLDVELGGRSGIETAGAVHRRNKDCLIFFVTNYEHYMDEALNKHAFRFWTKPIVYNRLEFGLESALAEMNERDKIIKVNVNKCKMNITVNSIIYAFTENRKTHIVTTYGALETKDTFKSIRQRLNESSFCDVHGSYCINMRYVVAYNASLVTCKYNDYVYEIPISKNKSAGFRQKFARWSGGTV